MSTDALERSLVLGAEDPVLLQHRIEQFLYEEAELLDDWRWNDWLRLFAPDVHYWMPIRRNRLRRQRAEDELAPRGPEMAHFDDDHASMSLRVRQMETGTHWAEDPPSRTRHLVTNVRVRPDDEEEGSFRVRSSFLCYRNRLEAEVDVWAGRRDDRLRPVADSFQIARRWILLDQNVVLSKNLSVFL